MREIVSLHTGGFGVNLGSSFWSQISGEHQVNPSTGKYEGHSDLQLEKISVYFQETASGRYVPRSIFADLDSGSIDQLRASDVGKSVRSDCMIAGRASAYGTWPVAHYGRGCDLMDSALDSLRRQAESCDALQGFHLFHHMAGGTGSGLGSSVLSKLREDYPDRICSTFTGMPGPRSNSIVTSPYNTALAVHHLIENADMTYIVDNDAVFNVATEKLGLAQPGYDAYNKIISRTLADITSTMRFPGQLNADLRCQIMNLIPFPRMHFFVCSSSLQRPKEFAEKAAYPTAEIIAWEAFNHRNFLCSTDTRHGRFFTGFTTFRGRISTKEAEAAMLDIQNKKTPYFINWIPNNIKTSYCDIPPVGQRTSATFVGNNTCIQESFKRTSEQFTAMFRKKTYLQNYLMEGMDQMEFTEAESNMNDLISEYQMSQDYNCAEDDEDDYDDDDY